MEIAGGEIHKLLFSAKYEMSLCMWLMVLSPHVLCAAGRKPKSQQSALPDGSPDLGIKKKPREGKGMLFIHWAFKNKQCICVVFITGNVLIFKNVMDEIVLILLEFFQCL